MTNQVQYCQSIVTNIKGLLHPLLYEVRKSLLNNSKIINFSADSQQLPLFAALLDTERKAKVLILDRSFALCRAEAKRLSAWSTYLGVNHDWQVLGAELTVQERQGDISSELSKTYHRFLSSSSRRQKHHFVVPVSALAVRIPSQNEYESSSRQISCGEKMSLRYLNKFLIRAGYIRYIDSLESGGWRVRGEQIDIRHPIWQGYCTVTFYGSLIEKIIWHQGRRSELRPNINIPPVALGESSQMLMEALHEKVVLKSSASIEAVGSCNIIYDAFNSRLKWPVSSLAEPTRAIRGANCWAVYQNRDRVEQYLAEHGAKSQVTQASNLGEVPVSLQGEDFILVTEAALFPNDKSVRKQSVSYQQGMLLVAQLREGRPAVHDDHGVGIYEGLKTRLLNGLARDYLVLRYAGGDSLSVPVEYAHKVTAYLGERTPPLHKLGGVVWSKARKRAREDAAKFAKDLLSIAAARAEARGQEYNFDEQKERVLDKSFGFSLTPDQLQAWHDIREDLGSSTVMDRLIIGDVGFGKTELAVRAAAQVLSNGRQVAILAPTTLLVQQHADTFRRRLPDVAAQIGVLSRFATAGEQSQVRHGIARGELNLVIGTHALLSEATKWKDLGLVVIDEEQKFGVKHKEVFKKMRSNIDMLSLSATPIPRTLSMALSGLKQMSVISTAPKGRKSVKVQVGRDLDKTIEQAVSFEIARGGQVYVVAPRVRGLAGLARRIQLLVPKAKVAVAHGQLPPRQLAGVMEEFDKEIVNVLVCSTIIESGLDLPSVNTILVLQATHFGLADLYQLKGRVGRRRRQGYAYFLYNQGQLTIDQRQRLTAITEAARLGSGWALAQRDLEIRGAGNLLGAEQSGTVVAVGVQLYLDMVRQASAELNEVVVRRHDVDIQLPLQAVIPAHYIADEQERVQAYQLMSRAATVKEMRRQLIAMERRYGRVPMEVANLYGWLRLQQVAARARITSITCRVIAPADQEDYTRLAVRGKELPKVLTHLQNLGNWQIRGDEITLDVKEVTLGLIRRMVEMLES